MTRRVTSALLLGLLVAASPMLRSTPVHAASGVDDYPSRLKNAAQDSVVDPWQFYNRECTSWVAWRLNSENGVAFNDYWQGVHWGNASNWRNAANQLHVPVDNNPTRGAVAWWAAGSAGSSRGHVAWVETVSDSAITIEEYNYLHEGHYDTRTISSSSSLWPSGFIHIKDTVVRNTTAPAVTGTPQVGKKLVTSHGSWTAKNLTFHYQWLANGSPISGATTKAFVPGAHQLGQHLRAQVTATKSGTHSGTAKTAATKSVAHGVFATGTAPVVSGTPQVGLSLSATTGVWRPAGSYSYQWYDDGKPIGGATDSTFTPTADQLAGALRVRVTATADGYRTHHMSSTVTEAVAPGQFTTKVPPTVSGTPQVDQQLTAKPGKWSPAGTVKYQWLADGKPITGATKTMYTPNADDLHRQISVQVSVTERGYSPGAATSAASDPVAPGTFLNTSPAGVTGVAQVGVQLRADHGVWTPDATFQYQWLVGGLPVPGATSRTFVPRPQDMGKKVALMLTAERAGYLTSVVQTDPTANVLPGLITSTGRPTLSGKPMVGRVLHATAGSWSIAPDVVTYQWYAGRHAIAGATGADYAPTSAVAGRHLHVVVTAKAVGYTDRSASSSRTDAVSLGRISFDRPTLTGRAVVGDALHARVSSLAPSSATAHYRWYRGDQPIRGARDASYVVQADDLGHRLHVMVTERATDWISTTHRSAEVRDIRTAPKLHVATSIRNGRVFVALSVTAPGLDSPDGTARALVGSRGVGRWRVHAGHGSHLLAPMSRGRHRVTVVYHGAGPQTSARTTVTVTVP